MAVVTPHALKERVNSILGEVGGTALLEGDVLLERAVLFFAWSVGGGGSIRGGRTIKGRRSNGINMVVGNMGVD